MLVLIKVVLGFLAVIFFWNFLRNFLRARNEIEEKRRQILLSIEMFVAHNMNQENIGRIHESATLVVVKKCINANRPGESYELQRGQGKNEFLLVRIETGMTVFEFKSDKLELEAKVA